MGTCALENGSWCRGLGRQDSVRPAVAGADLGGISQDGGQEAAEPCGRQGLKGGPVGFAQGGVWGVREEVFWSEHFVL